MAYSKQYFVATTGLDTNLGTIDAPLALIYKAHSLMSSGDTIYVRGGIYNITSTAILIKLTKNGIDSIQRSCLYAYPGERPILDFSNMGTPGVSGSNDGIKISGKYWHIKGLDIKGAQHNGIALNGGSYNIIELCNTYENRNTGVQLGNGASYNRIINCDSYFNRDSSSATSYDGNADGFAPKLNVGTWNYFYGCRAWQNSDDGWDGYLRPADSVYTVLENCWVFASGYYKNGLLGTGNGNGFKMGGGDNSNAAQLRHYMILKNCLAFDNKVKGFDQNNNRGSMTMINCTGFRNGTYNFSIAGFIREGEKLTIKNSISLSSSGVNLLSPPYTDFATNSWPDVSPYISRATVADFVSIDTTGVRGPRKPDGSLPDVAFMHLASSSQFIDAGTDVGLPFNGIAPDLGSFETDVISSSNINNKKNLATSFELLQNYPNPFNPKTIISYHLLVAGHIHLCIYDLIGRKVATLVDEVRTSGFYTVEWNADQIPSGIYLYQLDDGLRKQTKKMILMK